MVDKALNESVFSEYFDKNDALQEVYKETVKDLNLTPDEEVWLIQCSKGINIAQFKNRRLKLPGKSSYDNFECISEEYATYKHLPLALHPERVHNLSIRGKVIIREKLKNIKIESTEDTSSKKNVPFPEELKERHPLLGADYQEKLNLTKSVLKRLRKSEKSKLDNNKDIKSKHARGKDECFDYVDIKKEKKNKRNTNVSDKDVVNRKIIQESEINTDLVWINDL